MRPFGVPRPGRVGSPSPIPEVAIGRRTLAAALTLVAAASLGWRTTEGHQEPSAATVARLVSSESVPRMNPVARDSRRWDGLALWSSGLAPVRNRWDPGALEFRDASLRWMDSRDSGRNVFLSFVQVTEHQLTCTKRPGGDECFEWVVRTRLEEHRFRDVGWRQGENAKVAELFEYFRSVYPNLISSRRPADEK